jgi:uncharacterized protein YbaR (Trm112 family)
MFAQEGNADEEMLCPKCGERLAHKSIESGMTSDYLYCPADELIFSMEPPYECIGVMQ